MNTQNASGEMLGKRVAEVDNSGDIVFDSNVVASMLGMTAAEFMDEVRSGLVHQTHLRGTADDEGTTRTVFRHRARQLVLTLDGDGRVIRIE